MIIGALILAALLLGLLDKYWAPAAMKALRHSGSCDHTLAEPGQELTWSCQVENSSRLPIPYVRIREEFPPDLEIREKEDWIKVHCHLGDYRIFVEHRLSVRPKGRTTAQMKFSMPRRGTYQIGRGVLCTGDLVGLKEEEINVEGTTLVVMPRRSNNMKALNAAGGFMGDISVRRFILEDPILTVGFRDYTGREPLKSVSWTRTAQTGHMQVKQYDYTSELTAVVLLNTAGARGETFEELLRMTRSVCEELEKKKIPFSLRTNGNLPGPVGKIFQHPEGLGTSHLNTVLYGLGRADETCFYSLKTLVRQALRSRKYNDAYIVITPPLTGKESAIVGQLEAAGGNPICVLEVSEE